MRRQAFARSVALLACAGAVALRAGPLAAAPADALPEKNTCGSSAPPIALGPAQWNGWGRDLDNTRYQPEPAIRATDVPKLALKWAFGFQGSAVAGQPTVVDGRLFVASAAGRVYSLDAKSGCVYWTFDAPAGTHSAISIGEIAPSRKAVYPKLGKHKRTAAHLEIFKAPSVAFFGDDTGAVYALDAQTGTLLWKTQVDAHPMARIVGAPSLFHDKLYVVVASSEPAAARESTYACCSSRGSVAALDMNSGRLLWKTYTISEEPRPLRKNAAGIQVFGAAGAAILAAPTIDAKRGLLYVATSGALTSDELTLTDAVAAFDLLDGRLRWSRQFSLKDQPSTAGFSSSPILRTLASGKQILLAGQQAGIVYALDPERGGETLWQTKLAEGTIPGGIAWGFAADHRSVYVPLSGLVAEPENLFGSLTAIDMKTGVKRWHTAAPVPACAWGTENCAHAESQAVTVIPGAAFSGSMDGHLRAYSTTSGQIVWDVETAKDFATVNGVKASGGSLDQGGPTIVNGVVYVNSGYGQKLGQPGNVLLAYSVDGK